MNIYIFDEVEKLTSSYHEGGGLVVIAESINQAVELAQTTLHFFAVKKSKT